MTVLTDDPIRAANISRGITTVADAIDTVRDGLDDPRLDTLAREVKLLAVHTAELAGVVARLTQASLPVSRGHTAHARTAPEPADTTGQLAPEPDPIRSRLLELLGIREEDDEDDGEETTLDLLNRYAADQEKHSSDLAGVVRDVLNAAYPDRIPNAPWHVKSPAVQGLADVVKGLVERCRDMDNARAELADLKQQTKGLRISLAQTLQTYTDSDPGALSLDELVLSARTLIGQQAWRIDSAKVSLGT